MPGMMDTVLNLGLNDTSAETLAKSSGDERFAYDSYRRFIQMYSHVVLDVDDHEFEDILEHYKDGKGYTLDTDLSATDWRAVIVDYKAKVAESTGKPFPQDPREQLWGAIGAVFSSWMNPRAITYRRLNAIPADWGTAVNVQAMVFGNMGETSATGVAFTRNPSTGENKLYGEFLVNAQGEDVVAGIRTPQNITEAARKAAHSDRPSLEALMPEVFKQFAATRRCSRNITATCRTSSSRSSAANCGCCRPATASGPQSAALRVAVEMANEGLLRARTQSPGSSRARSISSCTRPSIRKRSLRRWRPACQRRRGRRAAKSSFRPMKLKRYAKPDESRSWSGSRPRLRTFMACMPPRAS